VRDNTVSETKETTESIPVDIGVVHMTHAERDVIWGSVVEGRKDWNSFVREALLEAAQR
jgi:hypothetical protein